jgi:hypothetical protein
MVVTTPHGYKSDCMSGYDEYLSLEWEKQWHPEIAEPEIALPQAVPLLHRLWHED